MLCVTCFGCCLFALVRFVFPNTFDSRANLIWFTLGKHKQVEMCCLHLGFTSIRFTMPFQMNKYRFLDQQKIRFLQFAVFFLLLFRKN